jgi:IS1 family transposase
LDIDLFLTDEWEAFRAVLAKAKHLIGKQFTKAIEGVNTFFRTNVRRLVRRTACFSKKTTPPRFNDQNHHLPQK